MADFFQEILHFFIKTIFFSVSSKQMNDSSSALHINDIAVGNLVQSFVEFKVQAILEACQFRICNPEIFIEFFRIYRFVEEAQWFDFKQLLVIAVITGYKDQNGIWIALPDLSCHGNPIHIFHLDIQIDYIIGAVFLDCFP